MLWRTEFAAVRGSILLLCLIFLSSLSVVALASLASAWSGQRMVSAYTSHQQVFMQAERELMAIEYRVLQHISHVGLEQVMATELPADLLPAGAIVELPVDWMVSGFLQPQCGPLVVVRLLSFSRTGSQLALQLRRDVCCDNASLCMEGDFTHHRRWWSRSPVMPADL